MAILVNNLNEDQDLYTFIRKVHEAYEIMVSLFLLFDVCISHSHALSQAEKVIGIKLVTADSVILNVCHYDVPRPPFTAF